MFDRREKLFSRQAMALMGGLVLVTIGALQWVEDRRALISGVEVSGRFLGTHEVRNAFAPEFTAADTLHPHVVINSPGGGQQTMVLADDMQPGDFAADATRGFLHVPGDPPDLRLPERLSPWGGPFIWWTLGIGLLMTLGAAWELRRVRKLD